MKKIVLIISVMAMSVGSLAASGGVQPQSKLGDFIDLIGNVKNAIDKKNHRRNDRRHDRADRNDRHDRRRRLVTERYSIPVRRGEVLNGDSIIAIRRALRAQGVRLEGKAIKSVTIRAKSRHGRARVALQLGRFDSRPQRIDGDRRSFRRRGRHTLHTVYLQAPLSVREQLARGGVQGLVRLNIRGNVKIRSVEVEVVRRRRRR